MKNVLSINVYGVKNDEKVIYPLRVSQTLVPGRHVDLLLYECGGIQHYTIISNFSRLVCSQLGNDNGAPQFLQEMSPWLQASRGPISPKIQGVGLPTYRNTCQHLL